MSERKDIKQEDRLDDLYRRSLGTLKVEPSARVWNRMSRQLLWKELLRFNFSNLPGYTWLILAAVAVITGAGIYWLASGEPGDTTPLPIVTEPSAGMEQPASTGQHAITEQPVVLAPVTPVRVKPYGPVPEQHAAVVQEEPADWSPVFTMTSAVPAREQETLLRMEPVSSNPFAFESVLPVNLVVVPNPKPALTSLEATGSGKVLPQSLGIGLNITPDMVYYKNTSDYFKYDYTLDAGILYNFGRFYLQSGVGIAWSSDIGQYAVSANKNDSVGYYYSVVSFSEDPGNPGKLEYTTSLSTVYDTNQYIFDYSTRNAYTYLQVPLVIGYRPILRPAWSMSVDAGAFWSVLISSNEPEPSFYIPEGRVTNVENITPARLSNSFGLLGSVRFDYRFAKQFSLMIAPVFKYHLNVIDDTNVPGATQPWSVGLRVGIWYRFDLKK